MTIAVTLTAIAGFVDLVGYLSLRHILAANMSGNTVSLAYGGVDHNWSLAFQRGWALLMFVVGLFVSAFMHEVGERRNFRRVASVTLSLEAALLALYLWLGQHLMVAGEIQPNTSSELYLLLAFSTLAMGIQNATLTRAGALSVRTTHVTGTISKFAEATSRYLIWIYDRVRGGRTLRYAIESSKRQRDFLDACITAALWLFFFLGALLGTFLKSRFELYSLLFPIALLLFLIAADLRAPFTEP